MTIVSRVRRSSGLACDASVVFAVAVVTALSAVGSPNASAAPSAGEENVDLLPRRPEVVAREMKDGSLRFTVRGRDCAVADYLALIAERGRPWHLDVEADATAEKPLATTLATIELYDRRPEQIVELLSAAAGVDLDFDAEGRHFKLIGATTRGTRPLLRNAIEQFYKMALARQGDDETSARSLRGLADVLRTSGDFSGAYAAYEQILAEHPASDYARDAELLLSDCYIELDQNGRANQLLRSFLAKCADPQKAQLGLRRLIALLLEQERYHEIATMHEVFERLGLLQPETLSALADAAAVMLEASDADVATFLVGTFRAHPVEHGLLGPVLALAFAKQGDVEASRLVLAKTAESFGSALDSTAALLAYGQISMRAGEYAAALLFAQRAARTATDNPILLRRAHLLLADVYEALGVAARVYHHLWQAEQLSSPEDAPRLALRAAEFALERHEPEHARLLFQSAAQYETASLDAGLGVARALLVAGGANDAERALAHLRELAARPCADVDRQRIRLLAAECHADAGRFDRALIALEGGDIESDDGAGENGEVVDQPAPAGGGT